MEVQNIVDLWKRSRTPRSQVYLATVVHVEGSSYRKPGARMLVTSTGERAGTISGSCLEADVSRKIHWLTNNGSTIQSYQSSFDDDQAGVPYGLGCGGTIWILMQTGLEAEAVLNALERAIDGGTQSVAVTYTSPDESPLTFVLSSLDQHDALVPSDFSQVHEVALQAAQLSLSTRRSSSGPHSDGDSLPVFVCLPILRPPQLYIFGAGADAQPLVRFGAELGWQITVADGRAHLLHRGRFPQAQSLRALEYVASPHNAAESPGLRTVIAIPSDAFVVLLTHSYQQDRFILEALLPKPPRYLGVLGPLHRTKRLIHEIAHGLGMDEDECLQKLYSPVGLEIGADGPSEIALSIMAEIQKELMGSVGLQKTEELDQRGHLPSAHAQSAILPRVRAIA